MPCLAWLAVVVATATAAQPVSFSNQIAPILAMNCHSCHGANPESAAGGLSTRTWADLQKGGNLGPVIFPSNPARSALLQFVNGARGEAHRMPLGGPPLTAVQIDWIQRWIEEGAVEDTDTTGKFRLEIPSVELDPAKPVRFFCKLPTTGYVELEIADAGGRVLYVDGIAVKAIRDVAAMATPDEWISWNLRRASHWPARVRALLTVSHAASEPVNTVFAVTEQTAGAAPEFPAGQAGVRVLSSPGGRLVFQGREEFPGGMPSLQRWVSRFDPGLYVMHLRSEGIRREMAVLFRVAAKLP